jgi:hypothetical protein
MWDILLPLIDLVIFSPQYWFSTKFSRPSLRRLWRAVEAPISPQVISLFLCNQRTRHCYDFLPSSCTCCLVALQLQLNFLYSSVHGTVYMSCTK